MLSNHHHHHPSIGFLLLFPSRTSVLINQSHSLSVPWIPDNQHPTFSLTGFEFFRVPFVSGLSLVCLRFFYLGCHHGCLSCSRHCGSPACKAIMFHCMDSLHFFLIFLSIDLHSFYFLATVNNASVNLDMQISSQHRVQSFGHIYRNAEMPMLIN